MKEIIEMNRAIVSKKKSIFFLFAFALGLFVMTSCNPSESGPDIRDPFLGTYNYTMTGSYTMKLAGQSVYTPLAEGGVVYVTKDGSGNRIKITGDGVLLNGVVEGDVIQLDPETQRESKDGISVVMTFEYSPAKLVNKKISIDGVIKGTVSGGGYTGSISGSLTFKATKQ